MWKADRMSRLPRRTLARLFTSAVLVAGLSACSSGTGSDAEAEEALATARDHLVETSGVKLHLTTDDLPSGISGLTGAEGVATNAPAFDGTITVELSGSTAQVPVIAVDDTVHAELPFSSGWSEVDPLDYGAPDPAGLIDPDDGFPGLLDVTEDAEVGKSVRGGKDNREVLTTYTGTVDGDAMKKVIPSSAGDSFDVEWQITDDGELRKAVLHGAFYPDSDDMTYTITFADYGTTQDITAP
jgi:lipoprotein LprG